MACIGLITKDFTECNTKGAEKAKSVLGKMDMGPEFGKRIRCCGAWKLRDCWMKAAKLKCKKSQAEQIYKLPVLLIPGIEEDCRDYMPESGKCEFPAVLLVAIVSVIALLLAACVGSIFFCFCRKKRQRRLSKLEEESGMYLNGHETTHPHHHRNLTGMIPGKRGIIVFNGDHHRHSNNTKTLMTVDGEDGKLMNGNCGKQHGHKHHHHHQHNGKVKANGSLKQQQQQKQQPPPPLPPPDIHVEMPTITETEVTEEEQKMLQ